MSACLSPLSVYLYVGHVLFFYLQTGDQVPQHADGPESLVKVFGDVPQDGVRVGVVADGLLDSGVDAGETLDGSVGQRSAVLNLLVEACRGGSLSLRLSACLSFSLSVCLHDCLRLCLSVCLSTCLYLSGCSGRRLAPWCCH